MKGNRSGIINNKNDQHFPANPTHFEEEIRRLAREMWPNSGGDGPIILDGRERDGVFVTADTVHILEATTDQKKAKAEKDIAKSIDLKKKLSSDGAYDGYNYKIWFITRSDPTAEQLDIAKKYRKKSRCPISALSGRNFQSHLVPVAEYLAARQNYRFGSVKNLDPENPGQSVSLNEFVPLDMISVSDSEPWGIENLVKAIREENGKFLILGEFGAGKSMTMRHVFTELREDHFAGRDTRFPVFLNLSDHVGQDDPSSALYDHAYKVGLSQPDTLVRAWRAGFVHLLLDGFDEMASSRFRGGSRGLRAARAKAMTLVRSFSKEHPITNSAILISGRQNYFDSESERLQALGFDHQKITELTLNEFSLQQVQSYIKKLNLNSDIIPDWMPSRPLLIGYLARHQIIKNSSSLSSLNRSAGWDYLLDLICEREASQIDAIGGAVSSVREFVDRLATRARQTISGRGPIPISDMTNVFEQIVPATADDAAEQLLLRMAGLAASASQGGNAVVTSPPNQSESREFVDEDLVDVARAGDVLRFIKNSYNENINGLFENSDARIIMGQLGVEIAVYRLEKSNASDRQCSAALNVAIKDLDSSALAFDIFRIMHDLNLEYVDTGKKGEYIIIKAIEIPTLEIYNNLNYSKVIFQDCLFGELHFVGNNRTLRGPKFKSCLIGDIFGAVSIKDFPPGIFDEDCDISQFKDTMDVSADIRKLPLSAPERVLLVSFRKLFLQKGKGRKESAFSRGLDDNERPYVIEVLEEIKANSFAAPHRIGGNTIWIPNRSKRDEALSILSAPQMSKNNIMKNVRKIV